VQRCRLIINYQPTPDLDVGRAITGITTNPCYLSQTEPVATALGWPLSQKTVRTGLLKVRHIHGDINILFVFILQKIDKIFIPLLVLLGFT